jgi:hypothetical protein
MSEPSPSLEEFLFEAALTKSSAEERAEFLDGVCRENPGLRARLDVLLEGHFQAEGFLGDESRKAQDKPAPPTATEDASSFMGRYKLLEKFGEVSDKLTPRPAFPGGGHCRALARFCPSALSRKKRTTKVICQIPQNRSRT